ncbi:MAG: PepSY domain-containing protein [Gemmatimonadaceae bacterium]|nr:PepSY domain-containing protein [Gemmatimonadaceae bacterium]
MHLAIGLAAGILIPLMSATGVLLGFERQMIAWIDGTPSVVPTEAAPMSLDDLLAAAGLERASVASVVVRANVTAPYTIRLRERGAAAVLLDPHRGGRVDANADERGRAFFAALRRWHRWVGAEAQGLRAKMKVVNGSANLVFLALVLSGLYLWWPRRWTRARLRATALPQWHRAGKVRDFNWHNSLGFWFAIPLALVIASGVFISFRWPGQVLDLALGSARERAEAAAALRGTTVAARGGAEASVAQASQERGSIAGTTTSQAAPVGARAPLERYLETARHAHPAWSQLTLTLPEGNGAVRVAVAEGNTYRPDLRWTLELDQASATLQRSSGYTDLSTARKIRAWVRFGHTGEVFGIFGQLLATIASAVGVLLVWTGYTLAWRRWRSWRQRRRRGPVMHGAVAG